MLLVWSTAYYVHYCTTCLTAVRYDLHEIVQLVSISVLIHVSCLMFTENIIFVKLIVSSLKEFVLEWMLMRLVNNFQDYHLVYLVSK
jgi:hypothetical protein